MVKEKQNSFWDNLKWLDPFTYVDKYVMPVVNPKGDKTIEAVVDVLFALIFAFVIYNFILAGLLGTASPLVIVYSGSMEPVLYRGDVAVLVGDKTLELATAKVDFPVGNRRIDEYAQIGYEQNNKYGFRQASIKIDQAEYRFDKSGPIVVYFSQLRGQDIIHRAVLKLQAPDGNFLLTFGDNNQRADQDCPGQTTQCILLYPVPETSVKGVHLFHIPLIGYAKLLPFDDLPRLLSGQA